MGKLINIAWKDLRITFRDPGALILMLGTPLVLILVMAAAFGGGSSVLQHVPTVVVNHDSGTMGATMLDALRSGGLADLLSTTELKDDGEARRRVDDGEAAAAIIIPVGFSGKITGKSTGAASEAPATVEVYTDPMRQVSAGVAASVAQSIVSRFVAGSVAAQVAVTRLMSAGLLAPADAAARANDIAARAASQAASSDFISVRAIDGGGQSGGGAGSGGFNWLAYMAPSMAIMFLMFTVTAGGRTLLAEREGGTLPRMLASPTNAAQVVAGKVFSIFVLGLVQMAILIVASTLLFGLNWGAVTGVVLLTLALVLAATGWGALLAAYCRTPAQAGQLGSMLALVFAIVSGNLVPRQIMPEWLRNASYFTPNSWGLEGYTKLAAGGSVGDLAMIVLPLLAMSAILFGGATLLFRRQYV